jgi:hypothetical protein
MRIYIFVQYWRIVENVYFPLNLVELSWNIEVVDPGWFILVWYLFGDALFLPLLSTPTKSSGEMNVPGYPAKINPLSLSTFIL